MLCYQRCLNKITIELEYPAWTRAYPIGVWSNGKMSVFKEIVMEKITKGKIAQIITIKFLLKNN